MDLPAVAAMVRSSPSIDRGCYNTSSGAPSPKEIPLPGARPPFIHGGLAAVERRPPFIHGGLATGNAARFAILSAGVFSSVYAHSAGIFSSV
ncbi:hypothetical protein Zm00014a_007983 [Zea mays]|uniref:Uncharacterized protein n=1 Tax=Zea mays TaxID=4577 RepID=A0A3L6DAM1_MAIZE|nr:hypothetical protein Zm00014a_007983 [Zea mays]